MPKDSMQIVNSSKNDKTRGKEIHNMEVESFEGDESMELPGEQMEFLHEPRPLAIDDSISEEGFESQATLRFHINLVKLSQIFGVCTEGYEREFFSLISRMGQKTIGEEQCNRDNNSNTTNQSVPKELRNLIFNMKFKEEEPRSRGRRLSIVEQ
ncbi:hypothetical protein MTR67_008756 [Solanum verrucosum]|uniref:Uncharacterized protein n=1 Tax=Solanum verrucosum TaxID=315347 RepID=A0AAF0Q7I8_SOLVR|nr:hypothetical protein MTR67_008756 [Solanum verrucosum]